MQKADQEIATLQATVNFLQNQQTTMQFAVFVINCNFFVSLGFKVARLETQVTRYRTASETLEKSEDELKVEKRKLQREVKKEMQYTFYSLVYNLIKMRS